MKMLVLMFLVLPKGRFTVYPVVLKEPVVN